jgi:hypothetical protein
MSGNDYAARVGTDWRDFTPQHARTREQAFAIARGDHGVPAGAVVGVYGSGKSTLLFAVLARIWEDGVLPVWEEASSFLDRLVAPGERVSPQQFVERVHCWVEGLRTDSEVLARFKGDLDRRQLGGVATAIEGALRRPANSAVLGKLLHPHAAARMERLICFHAGELPDLKPERQQLEALQGINAVMQRAKLVHKGIQALLGHQRRCRWSGDWEARQPSLCCPKVHCGRSTDLVFDSTQLKSPGRRPWRSG